MSNSHRANEAGASLRGLEAPARFTLDERDLQGRHARLDRALLRLCRRALPLTPVVVLDGQHQVTAAAAVLAGLTATLETQHVNLVDQTRPAGALHEVARGAKDANAGLNGGRGGGGRGRHGRVCLLLGCACESPVLSTLPLSHNS